MYQRNGYKEKVMVCQKMYFRLSMGIIHFIYAVLKLNFILAGTKIIQKI